jgi:hypothetical protein
MSVCTPRIAGPEYAVDAVAVEIADAGDLVIAGMAAEIHSAGPGAVIDQPLLGIAGGGIVPENAAGAAAGEVADACNTVAGRN